MTATWELGHSPVATWSRRLGAFAFVLFLTSAVSHRFGLLETLPFLCVLGLAFLLALSGLCMAVAAFVQIWELGMAGLVSAGLGAMLSLLALSPFAVAGYRVAAYPRIADVSTDLARPPQLLNAAKLRRPPMSALEADGDEAALIQADAYPALSGRRYQHARESVMEAVNGLLAERGWKLVSSTPVTGGGEGVILEAIAYSYLLGFPADIAIRVEDRWNAIHVDMRSASRYGRHDLGDNALRIERFLKDLDARLEESGRV